MEDTQGDGRGEVKQAELVWPRDEVSGAWGALIPVCEYLIRVYGCAGARFFFLVQAIS